MIKEMVKGEKEKMLERNLYIHNRDRPSQSLLNRARFELFMLTSLNGSQKPPFGARRCSR